MSDRDISCVEVETGDGPRASVIWLHGLGADGYDFEPVAGALDLGGLPAIRFVFPHAPYRPITINGGMTMRGWYDISEMNFALRRDDEAGIRDSGEIVEQLIRREASRGVAERTIVLAGFSQGGAIALHAGLRHRGPLAGIMALSTYLPLASALKDEAAPGSHALPLFMAHGRNDEVIPYAVGAASRDLLQQAGYAPSWHAYDLGHGVDMNEIADIGNWLRQTLGPIVGDHAAGG